MIKKFCKYTAISLLWLGIWQIVSMMIGKELLFPSPIAVAVRLFELMLTSDFYLTVGLSLFRILVGMLIGTFLGALGGLLTAFSRIARDIFAPLLAVVKSTPVASFIILMVLWISRDVTPLIIALMMVTPVVWTNVETGILNTDKSLLEMAKVYKMPRTATVRNIYLPSISPYFLASLKASLGMAWKAGIAAEVLLQPIISIGKMISDSKILLETTDLFAWTVVVVILSVIIEKAMVLILKKALKNTPTEQKGGVTNA
jgi:NitT/TauT family transport system permease protein